jgi:hypothetical protein
MAHKLTMLSEPFSRFDISISSHPGYRLSNAEIIGTNNVRYKESIKTEPSFFKRNVLVMANDDVI